MHSAKFPLEDWLRGSDADVVYKRYLWVSRYVMGPRVLDIGCSHGGLTRFIADKNIETYVGIDTSKKALQYAISNNKYKWAYFGNTVGDELFDTVVLAEVLEHQEDPGLLLKWAVDHVQEGGRLIITVPHGFDEHPDHRQVFHSTEFKDLLNNAGLAVLFLSYALGKIMCVCLPTGATKTAYIDSHIEENLSWKLQHWITRYRLLERRYEVLTGARLAKWLKGLVS